MTAFFRPLAAPALALCVAFCMTSCRGPLPPMALSPHGHGGLRQNKQPSPVAPLWRSNAISAPVVQPGCSTGGGAAGLSCAIPSPVSDPYARTLAEDFDTKSDTASMASPGGGG